MEGNKTYDGRERRLEREGILSPILQCLLKNHDGQG